MMILYLNILYSLWDVDLSKNKFKILVRYVYRYGVLVLEIIIHMLEYTLSLFLCIFIYAKEQKDTPICIQYFLPIFFFRNNPPSLYCM